MLKNLNFKLTTECGYRWKWEQNYYWKNPHFRSIFFDDRHVGGTTVDERVGIAFGPVMFFWNWK